MAVVEAAGLPPPDLPEIAFAGRSNVGKSSLLNVLTGGHVARVSSTPGRTRALQFFDVTIERNPEPSLCLVDLPGYGYARVSKTERREWPGLIEPYLETRPNMVLCIVLIDANIPPQDSDRHLVEWLRERERPFLVVATKADRHSRPKLPAALKVLGAPLGVRPVPVSARTGDGREELWDLILGAAHLRGKPRKPTT
jgi:GTP-binding protein